MTWRPSCARPGCAASRPCPIPSPTKAISTSWRRRRAKTRWPSACATWTTRARPNWFAAPPKRRGGPNMMVPACGARAAWPTARASPSPPMSTALPRGRCGRRRPGSSTWRSTTETGEVTLSRVFVGQDQGLVINPDGVRQQIHGNVIQTAGRVLTEEVSFDEISVTDQSFADYPPHHLPAAAGDPHLAGGTPRGSAPWRR